MYLLWGTSLDDLIRSAENGDRATTNPETRLGADEDLV
jgi:hypothetical protein